MFSFILFHNFVRYIFSYNGSPSPAKTRPSLPTSPTHIAAMRAATQQKHGGVPQAQTLAMGFDFSQTGIELPMSFMGGNSTQTLTQSQAQTGPSQAQQTFSVSVFVHFPCRV